MTRNFKKIISIALLLPGLVSAASYNCTGKVEQVTVAPNGEVNTTFNFGNGAGMAWQVVCSIAEPAVNNVPVGACKGILATLLIANQSQKNVQMWFDNATGGSCSSPAWQSLRQSGWYWGPSLMQ